MQEMLTLAVSQPLASVALRFGAEQNIRGAGQLTDIQVSQGYEQRACFPEGFQTMKFLRRLGVRKQFLRLCARQFQFPKGGSNFERRTPGNH